MSENAEPRASFARHIPALAAASVVALGVVVGFALGAPTAVLWFAFALLSGAVLLFWEAQRVALDPTAAGDADDEDEDGVPVALEARKRAALRALKDLDYERSIGRLGEEDHKALSARYREEAKAAMRSLDEGMQTWLERAEKLLREAERRATEETAEARPDEAPEAKTDEVVAGEAKTEEAAAPAASEAPRCRSCETANDVDAVFCKRCGSRMRDEVADA